MTSLDRRGVSEVVGVLLVTGVMFSVSSLFLFSQARTTGEATWGLVDLLRAGERRNREMLSLVYGFWEGSRVHLYLYNYGGMVVEPQKWYAARQEAVLLRMEDVATGREVDNLPPQTLCHVVLLSRGGVGTVAMVTKWRGVHTWSV